MDIAAMSRPKTKVSCNLQIKQVKPGIFWFFKEIELRARMDEIQGVPSKPEFPVQTLLTIFLEKCIKTVDVHSNYSVSEKLTFAIPHILCKKAALIIQTGVRLK